MTNQELLVRTMVELADSLVDDFDVDELLHLLVGRCVEILDVTTAGLMLAAPGGELRVVASSTEAMRVLELFEVQSEDGPCMDCFRSGRAVVNADLSGEDSRWPRFSPRAMAAGFRSADAIPLRLRGTVIGALNLFRAEAGGLAAADVGAAQALADIATIAILQNRVAREAKLLNEQLDHALNSRILIEQAKGILAERGHLDMPEAFTRLRSYARGHNLTLVVVAAGVVGGTITDL
ncbi:MAG: GAF and ANTAR domain-containing protein [Acidimicrobiales bacterium]